MPLPATACTTITAIDVTGGDGANVITLTGVTAAALQRAHQVDDRCRRRRRPIFGSELVDEMHGGAGNDQIIGDDNPAGTRDAFEGEAGDDLLIWRGGEDDDTMNGGDGADTIQVNGAGVAEEFTVKPSATAGRVSFDRSRRPARGRSTSTSARPSGSTSTPTAATTRSSTDAGLDALGFKLDIDGGDGNDTLDGGDGADLITGDAATTDHARRQPGRHA